MRYRLMATYQGVPYEAGIGPADGQVVLFAACPPPEELGFDPATGHWRKQLSMEYVQALWESRPMGRYRGQRCMVLDDLGDRLHIAYIGHDAFQAQELGYWQVDRGVYELVTPRDEVTEITEDRSDYFPPRSDTGSMPAINTGTMRAISTGNMPAVNTGSMPAVTTGPVPAVGYRPPADGYGPAADFGAVTTDFGPAPDYSAPPGFGAASAPGPGFGAVPGRGPGYREGPARGDGPRPGAPGGPGYGPSRIKPEGLRLSGARRVLPARRPRRASPRFPAARRARPRRPGRRWLRARHRRVPGARREAASDAGRPAGPVAAGASPLGASPLTSPDYRPGPAGRAAASAGPSALEAAAFRAATAASHSGPIDRGPAEAVPAGPGGRSPGRPGDDASGPIGAHLSEPIGTRPAAGSAGPAGLSGRPPARPGENTSGPIGPRPGDSISGPIGARPGGLEPPRATPGRRHLAQRDGGRARPGHRRRLGVRPDATARAAGPRSAADRAGRPRVAARWPRSAPRPG